MPVRPFESPVQRKLLAAATAICSVAERTMGSEVFLYKRVENLAFGNTVQKASLSLRVLEEINI